MRVAQPLRHAQGSKLPIITNDRLPCFSAAAACFAESYDRCIVLIRADNNSYLCLEVPVSVANLYQAAAELSWTQQEVAIAATGSQQHIWHHGGCYCRCAGCLTRPARHSQADGHSRLQEALSLQGQRWHALVRPLDCSRPICATSAVVSAKDHAVAAAGASCQAGPWLIRFTPCHHTFYMSLESPCVIHTQHAIHQSHLLIHSPPLCLPLLLSGSTSTRK